MNEVLPWAFHFSVEPWKVYCILGEEQNFVANIVTFWTSPLIQMTRTVWTAWTMRGGRISPSFPTLQVDENNIFVLLLHCHLRFITENDSWTSPPVLDTISDSRGTFRDRSKLNKFLSQIYLKSVLVLHEIRDFSLLRSPAVAAAHSLSVIATSRSYWQFLWR